MAILGFPCNQFLGQEPGSAEEIKAFCRKNYGVTFDLFAKVEVNGENACDLYKLLTSLDTKPKGAGKIGWNFEKFLIDRNGMVVARFGSGTKPDDPEVVAIIERTGENSGRGGGFTENDARPRMTIAGVRSLPFWLAPACTGGVHAFVHRLQGPATPPVRFLSDGGMGRRRSHRHRARASRCPGEGSAADEDFHRGTVLPARTAWMVSASVTNWA